MDSHGTALIKITAKTALWLFQKAAVYIKDGFGGDPFHDGDDFGAGMLDEIPADTPQYLFFSELLGFVRMIAGILRHELEEGNYLNGEEIDV